MKNIIKRVFCATCMIALTFVQVPGVAFAMDGDAVVSQDETLSGAMVTVNGKQYSANTTTLDLNNTQISNFEEFKEELAGLPNLIRVELKGSNLNNLQMEELTVAYPQVKFVWNINLGGYWTIATDQLAFSCNKGGGPSLTNADVEQLKYCTDMVALDLGHNSFTDISFVKYMPNLKCLIISDGRVSDLTPLKDCRNLVYFEGWFCPIRDLSPLQYLVNLKDVNVAHDRYCSDVTPLLTLPNLERIYMAYCNVPQSSVDALRAAFPNATIEMHEYYADKAGWRTHNRYYEMRKMYRSKYYESAAFAPSCNPLKHFEKVFDVYYYAAKYPEVVEQVGTDPLDLLYYFLNTGINEYQQGCEGFNVIEFARSRPDLREKFGADANKYLLYYINYVEE